MISEPLFIKERTKIILAFINILVCLSAFVFCGYVSESFLGTMVSIFGSSDAWTFLGGMIIVFSFLNANSEKGFGAVLNKLNDISTVWGIVFLLLSLIVGYEIWHMGGLLTEDIVVRGCTILYVIFVLNAIIISKILQHISDTILLPKSHVLYDLLFSTVHLPDSRMFSVDDFEVDGKSVIQYLVDQVDIVSKDKAKESLLTNPNIDKKVKFTNTDSFILQVDQNKIYEVVQFDDVMQAIWDEIYNHRIHDNFHDTKLREEFYKSIGVDDFDLYRKYITAIIFPKCYNAIRTVLFPTSNKVKVKTRLEHETSFVNTKLLNL